MQSVIWAPVKEHKKRFIKSSSTGSQLKPESGQVIISVFDTHSALSMRLTRQDEIPSRNTDNQSDSAESSKQSLILKAGLG